MPTPVNEARNLLARTAVGAAWVMAWRFGLRFLGLVSTLILVRLLAPEDFGLIALAAGFMQSIDGLMMISTEEAVIREKSPDRAVYDTAFTLNVLRGLAVALLVAALAVPTADFFADPRLVPLLLVMAWLPFLEGLTNIGVVDFRRNMTFHKEFWLMVLPKLFGIVVTIGAALMLRSYMAMLYGLIAGRTLRTVMSYTMHPYRPRLSLKAWQVLSGYSIWSWLLCMAVLLRDRADTLLLGRMTNPTSVGVYAVGAEIAALPTTELIEPLGRATFAGFAVARNSGMAMTETLARLMGNAALLTLPAGLGLSLVAAPLVRLAFGPAWDMAVPVLQVLAVAGTMTVFGQLCLHLLTVHGFLAGLVGIVLGGMALRVALLLAVIPSFGVAGAAWAAAAAICVEQSLTMAMAFRRFGISLARFSSQLWRPVLGAFAMVAVLWFADLGWMPARDEALVLPLVLAVSIGAVVYCGTVLLAWLASGRPDGAEADVLAVLRHLVRR